MPKEEKSPIDEYLKDYNPTMPVDAADIVQAEAAIADLKDLCEKGKLRTFATEILKSLERTDRNGQPVKGLDMATPDKAIAAILQQLQGIMAVREFDAQNVELNAGEILAKITQVRKEGFIVSPCNGGRRIYVKKVPGTRDLRAGDTIIVTANLDDIPTGEQNCINGEFIRALQA